MNSSKKPVVILDIDYTLFNTRVFETQTQLDEDAYIELLYGREKELFQKLVVEEDIPINIFSSHKEILRPHQTTDVNDESKRLKDYLTDYKAYQIYLVGDKIQRLKEAKEFDQEIITIFLDPTGGEESEGIDHKIQELKEIPAIIL